MRIIEAAANLDRIAEQLDDAARRAARPRHLDVAARRSVVQAGRLLLTLLDAGLVPPYPNAAALLGLLIFDEKGEPIPVTHLPDDRVLFVWRLHFIAWLRSLKPEAFKGGAGDYDWPRYRCDVKRPLTARGRPISTKDPRPQMFSPLGSIDRYDQADVFEHLRGQVGDWADACRAAAGVLRELKNRASQQEPPHANNELPDSGPAPLLFPDLPPLQRKLIDALAGKGKVRYSTVLKTAYKRAQPRQNEEESFHKFIARMNNALTRREPRVEVKRKGDSIWLSDINTDEPWTADGQK